MTTPADKEHLGIVICGHVDAGKSTTTGHLLFKLGGIQGRELEKLKEEAKALNMESFAFAFYMDRQKEERERGVTISCTTKEFFTDNYHYTIIDAPGHKDFIKNMISGASQADCALLLVPASGFEETIAKPDRKTGVMEGQTRQHARLLNLLGVEQLIVGINKMDAKEVNYSEDRYIEIRDEIQRMLSKVGYGKKVKEIPVIPMSGYQGENLIEKSDKMPWYKGFKIEKGGETIEGHTLVDALTKVNKVPKRNADAPLRIPVSGVLKIKGVGDIITGCVEQGTLKTGDQLVFAPNGAKGKCFSIEAHHRTVPQAIAGDNVGINVKGLDKKSMPKSGDVIFLESEKHPAQVESFKALVQVQEHPGQLRAAKDGKGGFTPVIHIRTGKCPCKVSKINWKMGKSTGKEKQADPDFLEKGDNAEVIFTPQMPFMCQTYKNCPGLGRVAVMDSNSLVMLGKVTDVTFKSV